MESRAGSWGDGDASWGGRARGQVVGSSRGEEKVGLIGNLIWVCGQEEAPCKGFEGSKRVHSSRGTGLGRGGTFTQGKEEDVGQVPMGEGRAPGRSLEQIFYPLSVQP